MKTLKSSFEFEVYEGIEALTTEDAFLLAEARSFTEQAYAPYSHFKVGAVARMDNGAIVSGSNQENASYPVGICAERVLLSAASSLYPNMPIKTMAIAYHNTNIEGLSNRPVSPCGICRQSLSEFEDRVKQGVRIILSGMEGEVYILSNAKLLLPLGFSAADMR
jgi:cytidine deaminase